MHAYVTIPYNNRVPQPRTVIQCAPALNIRDQGMIRRADYSRERVQRVPNLVVTEAKVKLRSLAQGCYYGDMLSLFVCNKFNVASSFRVESTRKYLSAYCKYAVYAR